MLTKRLLRTDDVLKINGDIRISILHIEGNVVINVASQHFHTAETGKLNGSKKNLGLILSRDNGGKIILIKKDKSGNLEEIMYILETVSENQVRMAIKAPENYLIARMEHLFPDQKEFVEAQEEPVLN